jgi:hypothetical protein
MNLPNIPFVQFREFDAIGLPLAGGSIEFFDLGNLSNHRPTWQNITGSVLNANPVVLDASGSAKVFCLGAYSYIIRSADSSIIAQGDFDAGNGSGSTGTFGVFDNYVALTNDGTHPACAVVLGGTAAGDGAGGTFIRTNHGTSDGATIITSGAYKYHRLLDDVIDPIWFGVVYAVSADQYVAFSAALVASVAYSKPVTLSGSVFINQDVSVPSGASILANQGSKLVAATTRTITFLSGSRFSSFASGVFGDNIKPIFAPGTVDAVRLSWMGDAAQTSRVLKWATAAQTATMEALIDVNCDCAGPLSVACRVHPAGGVINFTSLCNLNIPYLEHSGNTQAFSYASSAYVGTVKTWINNSSPVRPGWFSSSSAPTTDAAGNLAAIASGYVDLSGNATLTVQASGSHSFSSLYVTGDGVINFLGGGSWSFASLVLDGPDITVGTSTTLTSTVFRSNGGSTSVASGAVAPFPDSSNRRYLTETEVKTLLVDGAATLGSTLAIAGITTAHRIDAQNVNGAQYTASNYYIHKRFSAEYTSSGESIAVTVGAEYVSARFISAPSGAVNLVLPAAVDGAMICISFATDSSGMNMSVMNGAIVLGSLGNRDGMIVMGETSGWAVVAVANYI